MIVLVILVRRAFFTKNYNLFINKRFLKIMRQNNRTVPQYFLKMLPVPTVNFSRKYRYRYCGAFRKYRAHLCQLLFIFVVAVGAAKFLKSFYFLQKQF